MEEFINSEGRKISHIDPRTGIDRAYSNQFSFLASTYRTEGVKGLQDWLKENPFEIKKYGDAYSGAVSDKNKERVKRLDELAAHLNSILKDPDAIDENDFRKTCNELYLLTHGNTDGKSI